ncbi:hypothetical protein EAE96_006206 [Botrytis aclada]|nr:hypothetical protein EAE96_006206 [Botrytis aclada]
MAIESTLVRRPIPECIQFIDIDTVRKYARPKTFVIYERYLTNQVMKSASGSKKMLSPRLSPWKIVLQAGHLGWLRDKKLW